MSRRRRIPAVLAAITLAGLLVPLLASPAAAHEHRRVGKYNLVVGFGTEPAFAGTPNSVQLILSDAKDKPVTTLGDTLEVAVTTGDAEAKKMPLEPHFGDGWGEQGDYRAFFIPTTPGHYSFTFTGTIGGQEIDQTFTSGPKTFSDMAALAELQYPVQDPSGTQLTARLDREAARTQAALVAELANGGTTPLTGPLNSTISAHSLPPQAGVSFCSFKALRPHQSIMRDSCGALLPSPY